MQLELSSRVPFWFHGEIYFSLEDKGPKEVDIDALDDTSKQIVNEAIRRRILLQSGSGQGQQSNVEASLEKTSIVQKQTDDIVKNAKTCLKGSAKNVVAWCKKNARAASYQVLDAMLTLEKDSKTSRKTVISALEEVLENKGGITAVVEDTEDIDEVKIKVG